MCIEFRVVEKKKTVVQRALFCEASSLQLCHHLRNDWDVVRGAMDQSELSINPGLSHGGTLEHALKSAVFLNLEDVCQKIASEHHVIPSKELISKAIKCRYPINLSPLWSYLYQDANDHFLQAVKIGDLAKVQYFLQQPGVNPAYRRNRALSEASERGHTEIIRLLFEYPTVDPTDDDYAAVRGVSSEEALEILLDHPKMNPSLRRHKDIIMQDPDDCSLTDEEWRYQRSFVIRKIIELDGQNENLSLDYILNLMRDTETLRDPMRSPRPGEEFISDSIMTLCSTT